MSNRKSVFLSDESLAILGPFSSGRLNSIIEKYGYLIRSQRLDDYFSPEELAALYRLGKDIAIHERSSWHALTVPELEKLIKRDNTHEPAVNKDELIFKLFKMTTAQEITLIEQIEMYWADERIARFNAYRDSKK